MRLGLYGGTFDPPHLGHLILAGEAADQLALDRVLWVLTPNPPHKKGRAISSLEIRLEMLQAAIAGLPNHQFSDIEMCRSGPHYALDTVLELKHQFPKDEIIYLIGGDSLRDLPTWYQPNRLLQIVDGLGVMRRPGARINLAALRNELPGIMEKLLWVEAPLIQISGSLIRKRIHEGKEFRFFVPQAVFSIIQAKGLYR